MDTDDSRPSEEGERLSISRSGAAQEAAKGRPTPVGGLGQLPGS